MAPKTTPNTASLEASMAQLAVGMATVNNGITQLNAGAATVDSGVTQLTAGAATVDSGYAQINAAKADAAAALTETALTTLDTEITGPAEPLPRPKRKYTRRTKAPAADALKTAGTETTGPAEILARPKRKYTRRIKAPVAAPRPEGAGTPEAAAAGVLRESDVGAGPSGPAK